MALGIKVVIGYFLEFDKVVRFNGKKKQMKLSKYILRQKRKYGLLGGEFYFFTVFFPITI